MLNHGIPHDVRGGVHLCIPPSAIGSIPNLSGHAIAHRSRSLSRVRWHRASSPKGSSITGAIFLGFTMDQLIMCASRFPHPLLVCNVVCMCDTKSIGSGLCMYVCVFIKLPIKTVHSGRKGRVFVCTCVCTCVCTGSIQFLHICSNSTTSNFEPLWIKNHFLGSDK